jgi:hypothetical protein
MQDCALVMFIMCVFVLVSWILNTSCVMYCCEFNAMLCGDWCDNAVCQITCFEMQLATGRRAEHALRLIDDFSKGVASVCLIGNWKAEQTRLASCSDLARSSLLKGFSAMPTRIVWTRPALREDRTG